MKGYYEELQGFLEYDADLTWQGVLDEFVSKSYENLRDTLRYHGRVDLIARLDKNSGKYPSKMSYLDKLLWVAECDSQLTWEMLSRIFKGRTKAQLASLLYREGHKDLVQIINKASRKGI